MNTTRHGIDIRRTVFLALFMTVITVGAFVLGMQVGSLPGPETGNPPTGTPRMKISFRNISGFKPMTSKSVATAAPVREAPGIKLPTPEKTPAPVARTHPAAGNDRYIQIGAVKEKQSARALEQKLADLGFAHKTIEGGRITRVLAVVKGSDSDVSAALLKLKKAGIEGFAVTR